MKLQDIPFSEVARIYQEQAKTKLPLSEQEFREVISAEYMVSGRKGLGGPQAAEVRRMLSASGKARQTDIAQLNNHAVRQKSLDQAFSTLI